MMMKRLRRNPLFSRLTARARPPSLKDCVRLAVGLALISLLIGIFDLSRAMQGNADGPYVSNMLAWGLAWPLAFISPALVAVTAAILVSRHVGGEEYEFLRTTPMSEARVVQGYVAAALHRLRLLLALAVGLAPLMVVGTLTGVMRSMLSQLLNVAPRPGSPTPSYELALGDVAGPLVILAAIATGLLLANLLAAALGASLALWVRETRAAITFALAAMLLGAIVAVVALAIYGPAIGASYSEQAKLLLPSLTGIALCALPPIPLALGVMRLARRWV
jgi:hypothetical protein